MNLLGGYWGGENSPYFPRDAATDQLTNQPTDQLTDLPTDRIPRRPDGRLHDIRSFIHVCLSVYNYKLEVATPLTTHLYYRGIIIERLVEE